MSYNTIQLQNIDASIRKININTAVSLTIPHKVSAPRFCIMKSFKVNVLSWFPVCGTNTQGRVVWGGGVNCRWEKQVRKFGITVPEDLRLVHACTYIIVVVMFHCIDTLSKILLSAWELFRVDLQARNKHSILLLYFSSLFLQHRRIAGDAIRKCVPG